MRPGGLDIATTTEGSTLRVGVAGEIDLATVDRLVATVKDEAKPGSTVEIDLRDVTFMDSAGVAALNRCRRHLHELPAQLLVRCRAGGPVAQLLEWTGVRGIIDVRVE